MAVAPETYTHGHHASVLRSHSWRTVENSAGYLLPYLTGGARVLDVGCGVGTITAGLAERVRPGGMVVAVDRAEPALRAARATAQQRGAVDVEFRLGDVYHLDLPDASFDVVHAHQVLQHLTDPAAALREMRRVCRPGGLVAARDGDFATMTWYPDLPELREWLHLYHCVARGNGGEPDAGRRLAAWARAAGFRDVTASASVWCFATPRERDWWGGTWAERITASDFAGQALDHGFATRGDLDRMCDAWLRWAAHDDAWSAVVNGEIICGR